MVEFEDIDWKHIRDFLSLPKEWEPLPWQKDVVRAYLAGESAVIVGGRQAGRSTTVKVLYAVDELYG